MLTFDPSERISVTQALEHPWLASYHDVDDEPVCLKPFEKWREIEQLETLEEFREALWNEIEDYRREVRGIVVDLSSFTLGAVSSTGEVHDEKFGPLPTSAAVEEGKASEAYVPPQDEEKGEKDLGRSSERKGSIMAAPLSHIAESSQLADHAIPGTPTDPVVTYARRSSILQPTRRGSTYSSSHAQITHAPTFAEEPSPSVGSGIVFPSQGQNQSYIIPARSRTASMAGGGDVTRKLLRTLSTVSIHESAEGLPGGLSGIAPIGKFIVDERQTTGADAPPSEMPMDFGIDEGLEDEEDGNNEHGERKKKGRFALDSK